MSNPQQTSTKVLLGLSGNMLSSVVAALLRHQGFQVMGLHFKTDDHSLSEAQRVSQKLGISLMIEEAMDSANHYVIDHVVHQVLGNRKPEPEVIGHQKIIIEGLCAKAKELNCDKIATGHSARVALDPSTGLTRLLRGTDGQIDQSHLLFGLSALDLKHFILPIGDLGSAAVERLAIELELDPTKLKNRPAGFCALSEDTISAIAEDKIPKSMRVAGHIKTPEGTVLGEHTGLYQFRRGQSKGLPVQREKLEGRVVLDMNLSTQTLIVGPEDRLIKREVVVKDVNWLQPSPPIHGIQCEVRLGSAQITKCLVTQFKFGYVQVEFSEPQKNVVSGQAIVFYAGDEVLGGGFAV